MSLLGGYRFVDFGWRCDDGDEFDTLKRAREHARVNGGPTGRMRFWPVLTITFPPIRRHVESIWDD